MRLLVPLKLSMGAGKECACQGGSHFRRRLAGGAAAAGDAAAGCQSSARCLQGNPAAAQVKPPLILRTLFLGSRHHWLYVVLQLWHGLRPWRDLWAVQSDNDRQLVHNAGEE